VELEPSEEEPAPETIEEGAGWAEEGQKEGLDIADIFTEPELEEAIQNLARSSSAGRAFETYEEFKSDLGKQLEKEDAETHFSLGVEYMEMELFKEALREFKIAMKSPALEFGCFKRIAECTMAEGESEEAIIYYLKALKIFEGAEDERVQLLYDLAGAYDTAGHTVEAGTLLRSINEVEPGFRDVAARIKRLTRRKQTIPFDDAMIEVELL
ncbi:MAG: hypothetical protein ACE5EB_08715, partial [Thermodesulfobacteriota bacterium]